MTRGERRQKSRGKVEKIFLMAADCSKEYMKQKKSKNPEIEVLMRLMDRMSREIETIDGL